MPRTSAGLLPFVREEGATRVWLGHMGGPLWARRPRGWTIVKGEVEPDEDLLAAAEREFAEETGATAPDGPRLPLGQVRQSGGKVVHAWAIEVTKGADVTLVESNSFELEWPPRSGRRQSFPELDRGEWHDLDAARELVVAAQTAFLDRLESVSP
ncbi:NUDIX domain-containing protein [Helicobacter pylori]